MDSALTTRTDAPPAELSALHEELATLRRQLRRAEVLAEVGTMTAIVVHEFNNIFTTALGRAQLGCDGDDAARQRAVRFTIDACNRAVTICRALLDVAAGDAEATETVAVADLVGESLEAMARDPEKDGIVLVRQVPADLRITTRPVVLKQVLLNLLLNARTAAMAKGRGQNISVSAGPDKRNVLLRVADTGVGIPADRLERIFEPFFTTRNGSGTGLGLSFCKRAVEGLGGRIDVRSQLGKGAVFTVCLPGLARKRAKPRSGR